MARTDKVEQIYNSILSKLNTATAWENMLHRTAQFWKLSFVEAMLLTEQKPDATMCASLDQWNKIHRYVRRGEKAIAVYKSASDTELRYLFDISQTYGMAVNAKWQLSPKMIEGIINKFNSENNAYFTKFESFLQYTLDKNISSVYNYYSKLIPAMTNNARVFGLVYQSAMCICKFRCGMSADTDFSDIAKLKSEVSIIDIGNCATAAAREVLRELDGIIRRKEYEPYINTAVRGGYLRHTLRDEERSAVPEAREQGTQQDESSGTKGDRSDGRYGQDGTGLHQYERTISHNMGGDRSESRTEARSILQSLTQPNEQSGLHSSDRNGESGAGSSLGGNSQLRIMAERRMQIENNNSRDEEYYAVDDDEQLTADEDEYDEAVSDDTAFYYEANDSQLSLFNDEDIEKVSQPVPANEITDEMINHALRCGGNKTDSIKRITKQYLESRTTEEIVEFLKKEYGTCYHGFVFQKGNEDVQFAVKYCETGIEFAVGDKVYNNVQASISWDNAAQRIKAMLMEGTYASDELLNDVTHDYRYFIVASALWFLERDSNIENSIVPIEVYRAGYSGAVDNIKTALKNHDELQGYIERCEKYFEHYNNDPSILNIYATVEPDEVLRDLRALQNECVHFPISEDYVYDLRLFVTEDEKDMLFINGSAYSTTKRNIYNFFSEDHTQKEKTDFVRKQYGTGGTGSWEYSTEYDPKGYSYSKTINGVLAAASMKWSEVVNRIDTLIAQSRYITQRDIDGFVESARRYVINHLPSDKWEVARYDYNKKVLTEYGYNADDIISSGRSKIYSEAIREYSEYAIDKLRVNPELKAVFTDGDTVFYAAARAELGSMIEQCESVSPLGWGVDKTRLFIDKCTCDEDYRNELYLTVLTELNVRFTAASENVYDTDDEQIARLEELGAEKERLLNELYGPLEDGSYAMLKVDIGQSKEYPISDAHKIDGKNYRLYFNHDSGYSIRADIKQDGQVIENCLIAELGKNKAVVNDYLDGHNFSISNHINETAINAEKEESISDSLEVTIGFSEHPAFRDNDSYTMTFAAANKLLGDLDDKQHTEREVKDVGWYHKTDFTINAVINGEEYKYEGRYDLGDGEGSLLKHLHNCCDYYLSDEWRKAYLSDEAAYEDFRSSWEHNRDILFPFLEAHSELSDDDEELVRKILSTESEWWHRSDNASEEQRYEVIQTSDALASPDDAYAIWDYEKNEYYTVQDGEYENILTYSTEKEAHDALTSITADQDVGHNVPVGMSLHNVPDAVNFHFPDDFAYAQGKKAKFHDNLAAIKVLRAIERERRPATSDEQLALARYSGWGGIAEAFDENNDSWKSEFMELKNLLSDSEYKAARASTLTAFYTDPYIIKSIYAALEQFGFKGGRILDPSMGTGNFYGNMPQNIADNSKLYGVELDGLTAKIAKLLYPNAHIQNKGFEQTKYSEDSFDVIVGNVPFGEYKPYDRSYDKEYFIHDYFFVKSLDKLKPGGIAAMITSSGTLDKWDNEARLEMYKRAELIGAIRLPNTAFKTAGTEVVTDILFFQKLDRERDFNSEVRPNWLARDSMRIGLAWYSANKYFADNPDMILGTVKEVSGRFGAEQTVVSGDDIETQLDNAIRSLHAHFSAEPTYDEDFTEENTEKEKIPDGIRPFTYYVQDNKLYYAETDSAAPFKAKDNKTEQRIMAMCDIVSRTEHIIAIQRDGCTDDELAAEQKILNEKYDTFVKKYGNLNNSVNRRVFQDDVRTPRLLSLEIEIKGEDNSISYEKADIFSTRTVNQRREPTHADTALEALYHSLNYRQKVDVLYMAYLCGKSADEIIEELGDKIYCNPAHNNGDKYSGWETAEEYLSGYTRDKLGLAIAKAEEAPEMYTRNVEALKEHQPPYIPITDIGFRLGSIFIPPEMFTQFMYDTFDTGTLNRSRAFAKERISCEYITASNEWRIPNKYSDRNVKIDEMYGTKRLNAYELTELILNQKKAEVKDCIIEDGKEKYVLNRKETILAREKQSKIENAFHDWMLADPERIKSIETIYNEKYNAITPRTYDGSYVDVPGLGAGLSLRPHQKNAIARFPPSKCGLIAHGVGAGKTSWAAAHGMYYKAMGAINKPLYVIPNAVIGQFCEEFYRFFPEANILCATEKDFEKQNRRKFLSKISVGNYDAILISQSQFEKIPLSLERQEAMYDKKINEITISISDMLADAGNRMSVKRLESMRKSLEKKIDKLRADFKKDDFITFEELGVDYMYVDEAHVYKNLAIFTKMQNVAGINSNSNSQRAFDLEGKIRYLQEVNNGGGVALMTGTPISNAISEMFVWQYELQYDRLKELGIEYFDNWASVFGKITQTLEVKPSGSGFRMRTRFAEFVNLPELCNLFGEICDVVNTADLDLNLPKIAGGKPEMIICEKSPAQEQQTEIGLERARLIENKMVRPEEDNMLAICTYMTKVALDGRIIDPDAEDYDDSKVNKCIQRVLDIDKTYEKATHVIFCDTNTPKANDAFTVYQDIKDKLIASGQFTADEVAFVHDAKNDKQKIAMFAKANEGTIRVIIGSTSKLGTGVNIQQRLASMHHLDAPYRPSDIEQRNGRGIRQGNTNSEVYIGYYATRGTFDTYRWQLLENKQKTISQVMSGKPAARTCQDIDETALTFAEMKAAATDNPLIAEKLTIDNEVARLTLLKNDYLSQQSKLEYDIKEKYPHAILLNEARLANAREDVVAASADPITEDLRITINSREYSERVEAGKAIEAAVKKYMFSEDYRGKEPIYIGTFHGFEFGFRNKDSMSMELLLKGKNIYKTDYANSGTGAIIRLSNLFDKIAAQPEDLAAQIEYLNAQLDGAKAMYGKPFEHAGHLSELLEKQAYINAQLEFGEDKEEDVVDENAVVEVEAFDIINEDDEEEFDAAM